MARRTSIGRGSAGVSPARRQAVFLSPFPSARQRHVGVPLAPPLRSALGPILVFVLALLVMTPAQAQKTDRAKSIGHRMFCMCGCKQILVECNHVGCTMSTGMLKKLDAQVATGKSDDLILQAFVQEFGAEVIAEPPAKGFNWLAWIMPFAVVGAGLYVIRAVLSRWSRPAGPAPALPAGPAPPPDVLARIREETEQDD